MPNWIRAVLQVLQSPGESLPSSAAYAWVRIPDAGADDLVEPAMRSAQSTARRVMPGLHQSLMK